MEIQTLYPYLRGQTWVFDHARTGLKEEAFVLGMSEMITRLVEERAIPDAKNGFAIHFSAESIDGFDAELRWLRSDDSQMVHDEDGESTLMSGNWYAGNVAGQEMQGWLCPALLKFFPAPPARLFVRLESLPHGVDPIWHVEEGDTLASRFVAAPSTEKPISSETSP